MAILPEFPRERVSVEEAYEIGTKKALGASSKEIARSYPEFSKEILEKDDNVVSAELCLLDQIRKLAKRNLQSHLSMLETIRDEARNAEQYSAAVSAEKNRGTIFGFYDPERMSASSSPNSLEDLSIGELTSLLNQLENEEDE